MFRISDTHAHYTVFKLQMHHYSKLSQVLDLNADWRLAHPKFALNKWTQNARRPFDILKVQREMGHYFLFFIICLRIKSSTFKRGGEGDIRISPSKRSTRATVNLCCIVTQLFTYSHTLSGMMTFIFTIAERKLSITFIANVYFFAPISETWWFHFHRISRPCVSEAAISRTFRLKVVKCVQYN